MTKAFWKHRLPMAAFFLLYTSLSKESLAGFGIQAEAVNVYWAGASLTNRIANASGFYNGMQAYPNSVGYVGSQFWSNSDVWDQDFVDSDVNGNGDDYLYFDQANNNNAIAFFSGHGTADTGALGSCNHTSDCAGIPLPSACIAGPDQPGGCHFQTPRKIIVNGGNGAPFGNSVNYSDGLVRWGEASWNTWAGAGGNGGDNLVVLDLSNGAVPDLLVGQLWNVFAGVHIVSTLMAVAGDTADVSDRGATFAYLYRANPGSLVMASWAYTLNYLPQTDGGPCITSSYSNYGGGHGFNGCGCNVSLAMESTSERALMRFYDEDWFGLSGDGWDANGNAGYWTWSYICNYDSDGHPWSRP